MQRRFLVTEIVMETKKHHKIVGKVSIFKIIFEI